MRKLWGFMGILAVIGVLGSSFFSPHVLATSSFTEVEPNDTCAKAQDMGVLSSLNAPMSITGSLDGLNSTYPPPVTPNIDFFRITATPGSFLKINLAGQSSSQNPLANPFVGAFNYRCGLILTGGFDLSANLIVQVPFNGQLTIAATSYGDYTFTIGGPDAGSYTLTIDMFPMIGSISGQLVDSLTKKPIMPAINVSVSLDQCSTNEPASCSYILQRDQFLFTPQNTALSPGNFRVNAYADGYKPLTTPIFSVGANEDYKLGALEMNTLQQIGTISGRVIDSTKMPITNMNVTLFEIPWFSPIGSATSAADGRFSFSQATLGFPLYDTTYQVSLWGPGYDSSALPQFSPAKGADYDLGDVMVQTIPKIGSVSGRLVDAVTGEPLSGTELGYSEVSLMSCDGSGCNGMVAFTSLAADGRFRFDATNTWMMILPPGSYAISFSPAQYVAGQTAPFNVAEDENSDRGDIAVQPNPVRLLKGSDCGIIPAKGGTCQYTLRVVNTQKTAVSLRAWSTVTASSFSSTPPSYYYFNTTFQPQEAQRIRLRAGESHVVKFEFDVSKKVAPSTNICTQFYVANDAPGFYFAQAYQLGGVCVTKDGVGDFKPVQGDAERELRQRMNGVPEGQVNRP